MDDGAERSALGLSREEAAAVVARLALDRHLVLPHPLLDALAVLAAAAAPELVVRAEALAEHLVVDHLPTLGGEPPAGLLSLLEIALTGSRTVRIHYAAANGVESMRDVEPLLLRLTAGHWYLVAFCHARLATRSFRLDRFRAAMLLDPDADGAAHDPPAPPDAVDDGAAGPAALIDDAEG